MADWSQNVAIPFDRGYYAHDQHEPAGGSNAYMVDQDGNQINLFLTDIGANFQMGGSFAQSAQRREWFPHNFVQTRWTLKGTANNPYQYNRLAEFIRGTQVKGIRHSTTKILTNLYIYKGVLTTKEYSGAHFKGYVENMSRTNDRFQFTPEYTFDFIAAVVESTLFNQERANLAIIADWTEIFEKNKQAKTIDNAPAVNPGIGGVTGNIPPGGLF